MGYKSLAECVSDLEKHGHLIRIKEEVDPFLEAAAIHLRVFENEGPAILFENIKGTKFPAVSNLFGTLERSKFMFRDTLEAIKTLVDLKTGKGIYPEMLMQLAAYKALLVEHHYPVEQCRILRIGREESEGFEERVITNTEPHFKKFLALLDYYYANKAAK